MLDPFGRNATGNDSLVKVAFSLQPKEVSHIIGTPEGWVVLRLIKKLPPDGVNLEEVRSQLEKEMFEKKVQQEIPKAFKEMRDRADPKLFLKNALMERDLLRSSEQLLGAKSAAATLSPPQGH